MKEHPSRKKNFKKRKIEDCLQNLWQAEADNDKIRIKIWKDIIKKLEPDEGTKGKN